MNKLTKILDDNPPVVMFIIEMALILIMYLIVYYYYEDSSNSRDVFFNTFVIYIFSKFTLNLVYRKVLPPKCVLESDKRSCRF
jgi:hypothetical protein